MGLTVLSSSQPSRGGAAASRACASRLHLNPACIGSSAAAKEPKRLGSIRDGQPPTKRRRVGQDAGEAAAKAMSLEDKNKINGLLLSLLPPGRSPNEVIPLPDSIVRVLQENGTRSCEDGDEEIEIDVYSLGDDALRLIKDRVGAYLEGRAEHGESREQSKERVIRQSAPRSIPSKAAPKSIASKAAPPKGVLPRAVPSSIPPRPALLTIPLRAVHSPLAPPKPSQSWEFVTEDVETAISKSAPRSTPPTASPSLQAQTTLGSKKSMKELIADAGEVMKKVVRRREIEKLRAAARREVEQMVRTVEFNDPYIDYKDVFK